MLISERDQVHDARIARTLLGAPYDRVDFGKRSSTLQHKPTPKLNQEMTVLISERDQVHAEIPKILASSCAMTVLISEIDQVHRPALFPPLGHMPMTVLSSERDQVHVRLEST